MYILYIISLITIGVVGGLGFFKLKKTHKKGWFTILIVCLLFQGWYFYKDKQAEYYKNREDAYYQSENLRKQDKISNDINEMKQKEQKGLFTEADYGRYIALHLENINLSLRRLNSKNMRERITIYYEEVNKIPVYFNSQEWKESEKFIYDSMLDEINGDFSSRNMFDSGLRTKALEIFNKERNRLIQAKERELTK